MEVHVPQSVDEVVGLLGEGVLVAGGTYAVPRLGPTDSIVSLRHAGLSGIEHDGDHVRVGAATTLARQALFCLRRMAFV